LEVNEHGEDVTSMSIKEMLLTEKTKKEQPKGAWQQVVWRVIQEFGREQRSGIEIDAVIAEVKRITPVDTDNRGADRRKGYINRAIADMAARNLFQIDGNCINLN
jgi:hypothetical protein